jgi:hypothetical protein
MMRDMRAGRRWTWRGWARRDGTYYRWGTTDLHRQLFGLLMAPEWKHGIAAAVGITLLGRYYERFTDHAVEIGRRVIFQATGAVNDLM